MANRTIKKYANRRLYDTEDSKYVTLKDIKNIIAMGHDVSIIDDTSGDDITRGLLLQIVSEQELGGQPILSKTVLKQLIRFYGHPMQDIMSGYLTNSVSHCMSQMENVQEHMESLIDTSPFANLQEFTTKNMQAMADIQRQFFSPIVKPTQHQNNHNPRSNNSNTGDNDE